MLSSASNVAAWAKKGRDVERLLKTGTVPSQSRVSGPVSLRSRVKASVNLSSRSIVSNASIEHGSRVVSGMPTLSQGAEREYHTTSVLMKKKVVNTKSLATQGRKQKEKAEDDTSVKLTMKAGPGAGKKVEKKKTMKEMIEAQEKKAAAAAARPDGLLIHQKKQILKETVKSGGDMPMILESVKKLKAAYPATFALIRYQWLRMPISMRANLVTQSPDFRAILNDPDMKPFTEWLAQLDGRGGLYGENEVRKVIRRTIVGERLRLGQLWQEVDIGMAETRAEGEMADLHFPKELPPTEEELAEYDADEREEIKAIFKENILDDPEIQVVLNYMAFPRESIDPKGTLARASESESITDVDLLSIAQARPTINNIIMGFKNSIMRDMPEVIRDDMAALFELSRRPPPASQGPDALAVWQSRQDAAKARMKEAEQNGLTQSSDYAQAIASFKEEFNVPFVPDPVALRLLIDSAEKTLDTYLPEFRALSAQLGSAVATEIITERALDMDEGDDAAPPVRIGERPSKGRNMRVVEHESRSGEAVSSPQGAFGRGSSPEDIEEEDLELVYSEILEDMEDVGGEEADVALMPIYADTIRRELPNSNVSLNPALTPEQASRAADRYKADLDAWMNLKPIDDAFASEADREVMAAKTPDERVAALKRMMNVEDASLRQLTREMFYEYVDDVLEKTGFRDASDQPDHNIVSMVAKLKEVLASDKAIPAEEAKKVQEMLDMLDGLNDSDPLDSLPVENPETQFNETITTLQMAKDLILERHAEVNKLESRVESIIAKSREATKRLLGNGTPESPRHEAIEALEQVYNKVYGSQVPSITQGITAEDMMSQWATQMKEDVVMLEARSHIQRERDTISQLEASQMNSLTSVSRPPSPYERDFGIYPFTSADFVEQKPVEQRIYVSSSLPTDEIFTKENVGKYLSLSPTDLKRHLPEGFSLPLTKQEFAMTKTHDILIRQATLDAIANLKSQLNNSFLPPHRIGSSSSSSSSSVPSSSNSSNPSKASNSSKTTSNASKSVLDDAPRPMLLHGYRGCGKSAVMTQVVYWARRNDWLVVNIPDGTEYLSSGVYISKNSTEGTWDQPKLFVRFFAHLLNAHSDKLKQIPLKAKNVKIGKQVCKTLFDVVEYGSVLEASASQCFNIFRTEIRKVVEFPVLLAFDSYNSLYLPSRDFSDPESTSYHKQPLDPYNMSFGRLFYDAHLNPRLAYGTFIGGLTESMPVRPFIERVPRATRGIPMIQPKYLEVPPYTMPEFTTVMEHYKHKNWVRTHMNPGSASELYIYQITSGFGNAIFDFTTRL